jgi:hypothetical protein
MEEILSSWMVGVVMYLLFIARDAYRVCYAPVRTEFSVERSRYEE